MGSCKYEPTPALEVVTGKNRWKVAGRGHQEILLLDQKHPVLGWGRALARFAFSQWDRRTQISPVIALLALWTPFDGRAVVVGVQRRPLLKRPALPRPKHFFQDLLRVAADRLVL